MGIEYIAMGSVGGNTEQKTITFGTTNWSGGSVQEGDLVILFMSQSSYYGSFTINTTGYTFATPNAIGKEGTSRDIDFAVAYKIMGTTPDSSVSVTGQSYVSYMQISVIIIRNFNSESPIDTTSTYTSGTNIAINSPSITPATSGDLIISCGGIGTNASISTYNAPTNYTRVIFLNYGEVRTAVAYRILSNSDTEDPGSFYSGTSQSGASWVGVTLAIRPILTEKDTSKMLLMFD